MRLFVDECLSPTYAHRLNETGHDAVHPLHIGRRGWQDHTVVAHCVAEDRVIVTENAGDFRALVAREDIHPGLIILPCLDRESCWRLLLAAISWLEARGEPMAILVNHVLDVPEAGEPKLHPLP